MFQPLVVGADGDTYRRVDAMEERNRPSALLAPDGTRVLLGDERGATGDLILVDLTTGKRRSIPLGDPVGVRLLAWSPDGRHVAYSAAPLTGSGEFGSVNFVEAEVARTGTLRLLDLSSGRSTEVPAIKPAWTAAFAPDSRRLAVQVGQTAHLIDLDGREYGSVHISRGRELAAGVGWSPDGRFLATMPWLSDGPFNGTTGGDTGHGTFLWKVGNVEFVPLTGAGTPPAPVQDVVQLLGWRSRGQRDRRDHQRRRSRVARRGAARRRHPPDPVPLRHRSYLRAGHPEPASVFGPAPRRRSAARPHRPERRSPAARSLADARERRHRRGRPRRRVAAVAPDTSVNASPTTGSGIAAP